MKNDKEKGCDYRQKEALVHHPRAWKARWLQGQMWGAWARRVGDEAGELGRLWYKKDLVGFTQKFRCDPVGSEEPLKGEQQNRVI